MSAAQSRVEWFGKLRVDQPVKEHRLVEDSRLCSTNRTYICTGCSWTVEVHPAPDAAADDALNRAFAKHLLTTAAEAVP